MMNGIVGLRFMSVVFFCLNVEGLLRLLVVIKIVGCWEVFKFFLIVFGSLFIIIFVMGFLVFCFFCGVMIIMLN